MRVILTAVLVALASPAIAAPATLVGTSRRAAATVDAFHAALNHGDTRGAARLLSERAMIFEEGHVERSKAEYAAHHLPADAAFSQTVRSTVTRRSGGGSGASAWVATEGRTSGTYKGKLVDRITTETMLLERARGGWKIVHIHWSSRAAKAD